MNPVDRREKLQERPFAFRETKDGKVFIAWHGKPVVTLQGKAAEKFLAAASSADADQAQLLMARITGNFKRGNEKSKKGD
ncbi:MAG: hypothetical protein JNK32_11685 [Anaerolineales bacterium]|nr:hypothetical protein [Anaerolineales bacterium]